MSKKDGRGGEGREGKGCLCRCGTPMDPGQCRRGNYGGVIPVLNHVEGVETSQQRYLQQ